MRKIDDHGGGKPGTYHGFCVAELLACRSGTMGPHHGISRACGQLMIQVCHQNAHGGRSQRKLTNSECCFGDGDEYTARPIDIAQAQDGGKSLIHPLRGLVTKPKGDRGLAFHRYTDLALPPPRFHDFTAENKPCCVVRIL